MKSSAIVSVAICFLAVAVALPRVRRAAFEYVQDADLIVPNLRDTFSCEGLTYGYYADTDNDCKVFHICHPRVLADGEEVMEHYSFICGNQTMFDQVSRTCAHPDDAVPCDSARNYYYLNDNFGVLDAPSVRDEDLESSNQLKPSFGGRTNAKK